MDKKQGVVNIRGKEYTTVAKRVADFRQEHKTWTIKTTLLERTGDVVLMLAEILDDSGRLIGNGHAEEWRKSSEINKTSAIENAETSAIGRALANLGYGGTEFASANEIDIARAKAQVEPPPEVKPGMDEKTIAGFQGKMDKAKDADDLREITKKALGAAGAGTEAYNTLREYAISCAANFVKEAA